MTDAAKAARRDYLREYKRKNAAKINAYNRKWRKDNPEKVKEYNLKYWSKKAQEAQAHEL